MAAARVDAATDRVTCKVGAGLNFIDIVPLLRSTAARKLSAALVRNGQHNDKGEQTLGEFRPPRDNGGLEIGLASHAPLVSVDDVLGGRGKRGQAQELWDGYVVPCIVADLWRWLRPPGLETRTA